MVTIFGLPRPFRGHIDVIQRNAITSWTRLRPKPEIVLFGNEEGTAAVARELEVNHVREVKCNEFGTPLLDDVFTKAREMATHDILCYANADMVFMNDFMKAVQQVATWRDRFLMVGRRTNLDLNELQDFESPGWEARLGVLVSKQGVLGGPGSIDYFVFPRSLELNMPPFAIGRPWWDQWFLWKVRALKVAIVDASRVVTAIHQNHDFSHVRHQGSLGVYNSEEGMRNYKLVGPARVRTIDDATHKVTAKGIKWYGTHLFVPSSKRGWAALMNKTGPIRHRLGIRRTTLTRLANLVGGTGTAKK
jgi:hypothetical protein